MGGGWVWGGGVPTRVVKPVCVAGVVRRGEGGGVTAAVGWATRGCWNVCSVGGGTGSQSSNVRQSTWCLKYQNARNGNQEPAASGLMVMSGDRQRQCPHKVSVVGGEPRNPNRRQRPNQKSFRQTCPEKAGGGGKVGRAEMRGGVRNRWCGSAKLENQTAVRGSNASRTWGTRTTGNWGNGWFSTNPM